MSDSEDDKPLRATVATESRVSMSIDADESDTFVRSSHSGAVFFPSFELTNMFILPLYSIRTHIVASFCSCALLVRFCVARHIYIYTFTLYTPVNR